MSTLDPQKVMACTPPIAQETSEGDLGYGYIYYGLTRWLKPDHVLVIGSGYGFTPGTIALALQHNRHGVLSFVDPSYSNTREGPDAAHGGAGTWDTPEAVEKRFSCLGVDVSRVTHFKQTNREFFESATVRIPPALVVIDGAHDYANAHYDLQQTLRVMKIPGYVLLHDSTNFWNRTGHMGVAKLVEQVRGAGKQVEVFTLPGRAGLTLLRVTEAGKGLSIDYLPGGKSLAYFAVGAAVCVGIGFLLGRWTS